MRIVCSKCNTEYDIDLPRTALDGRHRSLKFRCSNCGHIFNTSVDPSPAREATPEAAAARPAAPPPGTKGMLVKQEGKIYNVRDLATLQRWIIERRVTRDDLVSFGGTAWEAAAVRPELESFFEIVEKADHVSSAPTVDDPNAPSAQPRVGWEKTDAGTERPELMARAAAPAAVAPAPPPAAPASEDGGEILGALEADEEDMEAAAAEEDAHEAEEADEAEEAAEADEVDDPVRTHLRDDLSPALSAAPREEKGGIPAFPMGGGLSSRPADPLAMGTTIVRGQTGRDQVFDAFSMDEVGESPAAPVAPVMPVTPVTPVAPLAPMASVSAARMREPGASLKGDTPPPNTGPIPIAAPIPAAGPSVVAPPPVPVVAAPPPAGPSRRSRELDWDEGAPRAPGVPWMQVGFVAMVFLVGGLVVKVFLTPTAPAQPAQPVLVYTTAPPVTPTPAVTPTTAPVTAPVVAPTAPVVAPTAPEVAPTVTAPEVKAPETPAVTPKTTTAKTTSGSVAPGSKGAVKQGWAAIEKGEYSKARQLCMDVAADSPSNGDAQYCVGQAAQNQGDTSTAVDRYCRALNGQISASDAREIQGILSGLGKTCN